MASCFSCGRGCCDHSSTAQQLPSLVSIEVVGDIFLQAIKNTAKRSVAAARGELSAEDIEEADEKLVDWLSTTFCGGNRYFSCGEDWNPNGLSIYIRDLMGDRLTELTGTVPDDDEEVICSAVTAFLKDVYDLLQRTADRGIDLEDIERVPQTATLVNFWARLMTGAPAESLLN